MGTQLSVTVKAREPDRGLHFAHGNGPDKMEVVMSEINIPSLRTARRFGPGNCLFFREKLFRLVKNFIIAEERLKAKHWLLWSSTN